MSPKHSTAILQALLVTFLWSTSWVFIKIGLADIPALTFAGLRYSLAFLCLLPIVLRPQQRAALKALTRRDWLWLMVLGLVFYALTQGTQFVALVYLPSATLSLLLNFSAVIVALSSIVLLNEKPTRRQWGGIIIFISGVLVYFYPLALPAAELFGLLVGVVSVIANAAAALLGRYINRRQHLPAVVVTTVSMGIGSAVLLIGGITAQGLPQITPANGLIVLWLAVVNTAFAFTLWNHTLRALSAVESSVINNTMLIQIAVLAWVFLGEAISPAGIVGIGLASAGILIVQLSGKH